ncbi:DUF5615 family PIN-like protein [Halonotius sp. GCM10025705]|uniref:DUF5615 family PIN-like protein n=1 Tax=Halonotius sp. GCM10025705 TaxID=3252678 RepID=UPI003606875F
MRVLCDQMVKASYVAVLETESTHTVDRVRDVLRPTATDDAIAAYATTNDWVVLTADDDFFDETVPHGLCYYTDSDPPPPRILVEAINAIDTAYDDPAAITEWVPDGWV